MIVSKEAFNKIMSYLDVIEAELNKVAESVNHPSYAEFYADNS